MISPEEYTELRSRYDQYQSLCEDYRLQHKTNGIPVTAMIDWPKISNDEIGEIELYEFIADPPDRYFAYVKYNLDDFTTRPSRKPYFYQKMKIVTYGGIVLASGRFTSNLWTSNFGDNRITFTVKGINGKVYHGTFYYSAGDYCRMRLAKDFKSIFWKEN